ncbi:MAG TPA: hypothetical protein EYP28_03735 [Methanophagales archaeon]|nr:hypothetical protein [Methanophagales archaeon]
MKKMTSSEEGEEKWNRKKFEAEYIAWVENAAKEIAETLKTLEVTKISEIIEFYEKNLGHPASMHQPLDSEEKKAVEKFIGKDRLKDTIVLKNRALIFAPSILVPSTASLDYGTAMHRRFLLRGLWFSVIALNEAYLNSATELMLKYMLEHELTQGEIYKELAEHPLKIISSEIKGAVHEEARIKAIQRSAISGDEVERERQLILNLSTEYPVVPVQFASASLFRYLEENWEEIKQFGVASQNETEKELEHHAHKFTDWTDFARNSFEIFLKSLKREITMTGVEYGAGIV